MLKSPLKNSFLVLWLAVFAAGAALASGDEDIALEYQVKAAFIFNFARFVTWPAGTFPSSESPLLIGLLGHDPFSEALQKTLDGKMVEGRPLVVKQLASADSPAQILVVPPAVKPPAGRPMLTVSESKTFLKEGGMIRLDVVEDKVRFSINQAAVDQSGLTISSQMLQYAGGGN